VEGQDAPEEWFVSRVCEEFGCLPSEALAELQDGPTRLVLDVMELRAYAEAKRAVEQIYKEAKARVERDQDMAGLDLPEAPMVKLVIEIQREIEGEG